MTYGLCKLSIVPLRGQAKHSSEMVTQLLWGECYEVLEQKKEWLKIRCYFDGYEAWLDRKQHTPISTQQWQEYTQCQTFCPLAVENLANAQQYRLLGSPILDIKDDSNDFEQASLADKQTQLEESALLFLNTPYLWGGRSVFGVDCSGYMQLIYRLIGLLLPRDAYQQAEIGQAIDFGQQKLGDLAFFANEKGRITHVGMIWSDGQIIHASGKVRIDILDSKGIKVGEEYSHQLAYLKRVL
ncbi:MAG: C40 family peptidase [Aureispira sp.]|nr:C40 family peptidase [Aureispira sp.]